MRVIAGERRRYKLFSPRGDKIRPTADIIKETLFNMIGDDLYDTVFCDLYAGTGQIGIEALSRGAKFCVFLDRDKDAIKLIRENIEHVGYEEYSAVVSGVLPASIKRIEEYSPDVFFLDPPYSKGLYEPTLAEISSLLCVNEDTLIIAESSINEDFSFVSNYGLYIEKEKLYKSSKHIFLRKENA